MKHITVRVPKKRGLFKRLRDIIFNDRDKRGYIEKAVLIGSSNAVTRAE